MSNLPALLIGDYFRRTVGVAAVGSGSSNAMNPMTVNGVPSGPRVGNWPILELINCGGNLIWHYRCENQLGTLSLMKAALPFGYVRFTNGMTDEEGIRVAEFDTSKYGEVYHKHPLWRGSASPNPRSLRELFDGRASRIDSASWEPLSRVTHILLVPGVFFTEEVIGAVLRATNSESAATAVVTEVDPNGAYIQFDDPNGAVADIVSNDDGQFLIWDNRQTAYTGYPTTGGTWTDVELYTDPQFGMRTILHAAGEDFREFMVGWQVQVNAAVPVYLDIVTTTGDGICVSGDVSALVTAEETEFCIIHPVGVNPQNGATQTDPCQPESRYLWGGGYYLPPIAGFEMWHDGVFGIHGQQPGQNKSGQHYMWNRCFDNNMGRWTTPDPARSLFVSLFDYVSCNPLHRRDPSGLDEGVDEVGTGKIDKEWAESEDYSVNDGCGYFKLKVQVVAGAQAAGAEARYWVKVEYNPHKSDPVLPWCCTCDNIRLVQFVRVVRDGEAVSVGDKGTQAGGELGSDDEDRKKIGKKMKKLAGKDGWGVDLPADAFEGLADDDAPPPWYVGGSGTKWGPVSGYRKVGTKQGAQIYDTPILPLDARDGTYSQEFQTCAVCDDGTTNYSGMKDLGCINWRVRHLKDTPKGKDTKQVVEITGTSNSMGSSQAGALENYDQ